MMKLVDTKLLFAIIVIVIFGLIMVLSASYPKHGMHYFYLQFGYVSIGIIASIPLLYRWWNIDSYFLKNYSKVLYWLTIIALLSVFMPIDGNTVNGSTRWINFGIAKLQPSEIAKLTMLIIAARFITEQKSHEYIGIFKILLYLFGMVTLLLFEADFGATIIIAMTIIAMVFVAGIKIRVLFIVMLISVAVLALLIFLTDNRFDRIAAFFTGDGTALDSQRLQALIGIVRGDIFGIGIGGSLQKLGALPEAHNDMIFAIIGEETGVIGMLVLVLLFAYIFYKIFKISRDCLKKSRPFQGYLAFGIGFILSTQTMLNLSVSLSLVPPKGITLPLISYGGSSMLFTIIMLAIILKIDIENKEKINL